MKDFLLNPRKSLVYDVPFVVCIDDDLEKNLSLKDRILDKLTSYSTKVEAGKRYVYRRIQYKDGKQQDEFQVVIDE